MVEIGKYPVLNDKYTLCRQLGEGQTSKVYLGRKVGNQDEKVAVKVMKREFLETGDEARKTIVSEIEILEKIKHPNIVFIEDYGDDGKITKPSGSTKQNLVFLVLEYAPGGLLFEICEDVGQMGENNARVFFKEILTGVQFMHKQGISHRDIKLENILLDNSLNIKIADLGFATTGQGLLQSYKGTQVYMAPEIGAGEEYLGNKADIFSLGVTLFTLVNGIFPFTASKEDDQYYSFIAKNDFLGYWAEVELEDISKEFKDLFQKMVTRDPAKRCTLEEVLAHPWITMDTGKSDADIKVDLAAKINEIREERMRQRQEKVIESQGKGKKNYRDIPVDEDEFNQEAAYDHSYQNSNLREWCTKMAAQEFWDQLDDISTEMESFQLQKDEEKKKFYLVIEEKGLKIKMKFHKDDVEEVQRVSFIKKQGSIVDFVKLLKEIQEQMEALLAPEAGH